MRNTIELAVLVFAGMENIFRQEMKLRQVPYEWVSTARLRNHDLIRLRTDSEDFLAFRRFQTVEDIFIPLVSGVEIAQPKDLNKVNRYWKRDELFAALELKSHFGGRPRQKQTTRYAIFVKQDRDRQVFRRQIAQSVAANLGSFRNWVEREPADLEFWGFFIDNHLTIGLRLTDNQFRKRTYRAEERLGALRPTIAAGLVVLSDPAANDRLIDPMCGTGTILAERAQFADYSFLYAGDRDPKAVQICRESLRAAAGAFEGDKWQVRQWDALQLPLADHSVNKVVCNLPWGKQYSSPGPIDRFYGELLAEFRRILEPGGKIVLLTGDITALRRALDRKEIRYVLEGKVKVLGKWAGVFSLC